MGSTRLEAFSDGVIAILITIMVLDLRSPISESLNSLVFYLIAIPSAFVSHWIAAALYLLVALLWLVPDRRIERVIQG